MTRRFNNSPSTALLIVLTVFFVYGLTYFVAVKPAALVAISAGQGPWPRTPEYRFGTWSETVYAPILWLDRRVFPSRWLVTRADVQKSIGGQGKP
jgi:hypothetical protein